MSGTGGASLKKIGTGPRAVQSLRNFRGLRQASATWDRCGGLRLRAAQDRLHGPQEHPWIVHRCPRSSPGSPTEAQEAAQDTPQRIQQRPNTAHKTPRAAQDHPQRPQEQPKTSHRGPVSRPRSLTEAPRQPKTSRIGCGERVSRLPTYAPRAAQDSQQRP